jgi:hypothetical protein
VNVEGEFHEILIIYLRIYLFYDTHISDWRLGADVPLVLEPIP